MTLWGAVMKVRELMKAKPLTVRPSDTWSVAAQMMLWAGIRHLPIVDNERLVGLISERDLLALRDRSEWSETLEKKATGQVQSTHPDASMVEIAGRMAEAKMDCLPVVEAGKLVGLLTTTDLLTQVVREALHAEPRLTGLVHEVMTPDPDVAAFDDLLLDAVGRMNNRGVRHLPVVDGNRRVVGMLSDRDVRTAVGDLFVRGDEKSMSVRLQVERVSDVARHAPITVREDAPLSTAIRLLVDHRIGALPVVDAQERLVGIISYMDILGRSLLGAQAGARPVSAGVQPGRGAQPVRH